MSTPPPVPPDLPEIPPRSGTLQTPPPVPGESHPPVPSAAPSLPPPVSYPPVVPPQSTPGTGTKGLLYGCLVLLAVGGITAVIGGIWAFKKVKGIAENPEQFIAEMAVKANPDLELIRVDNTAREVVVKEKRSGETTVFSFDDVKNGKIGLKKSDGSSAGLGPDGIRMKDKDGTESTIGGGGKVPLPAWVPSYPGDSTVVMSSQKVSGLNQTGQSALLTPDAIAGASAAYLKVLEDARFQVTRENSTVDGVNVVSLEATAPLEGGGEERIKVRFLAQEKGTMIHLDYSHKEPDTGTLLQK